MEQSIARRRCVTTFECVCVYVYVRPVVMETCCRFSAPAAGWCHVASWDLAVSLAGVHGLHVGGAGVPLDGVKDGRQLLIGRDLGLELRHQRRLLGLGDRQQRHDGSHRRPLQLVLLLELLLHRVRLHLRRRPGRKVIKYFYLFTEVQFQIYIYSTLFQFEGNYILF